MALTAEERRIHGIEGVAGSIGDIQESIHIVAKRLHLRARTRDEADDVKMLRAIWDDLEALKIGLTSGTPYGSNVIRKFPYGRG